MGRYPAVPYRVGLEHRAHELVEPLAAQAGDGHQRHAFDLRQEPATSLAQFVQAFLPFANEIPFVDGDDERPAFLRDQSRDLQVLLLKGLPVSYTHLTLPTIYSV